jgi:hypothetical protein
LKQISQFQGDFCSVRGTVFKNSFPTAKTSLANRKKRKRGSSSNKPVANQESGRHPFQNILAPRRVAIGGLLPN